ncbi:MAG: VOC family protein [Nannocystaceae bacterium]
MSIDRGRFTWFEQLSDAPATAQRFYTEVLPWTIESFAMGEARYPMIKAGASTVGGFATLPPGVKQAHWISYVTVDDVDRVAKAVTAAGGKALMDAFEVPTVGRMQPVADPEGAALFLFTPADGSGEASSGPGTFHWNELWCKDAKRAVAFYETVLGYSHEARSMPNGTYYVLRRDGQSRAGIMQAPAAEIPSHWLPYVEVADLDGTVKRALRNGGTQEGDAMEVPGVGRFAFVRDTQGARLGLITPASRA